jgi:hypothetical protein
MWSTPVDRSLVFLHISRALSAPVPPCGSGPMSVRHALLRARIMTLRGAVSGAIGRWTRGGKDMRHTLFFVLDSLHRS